MVEFALIVPIVLVLLLITVDFGRVFASYVQISNAAREGAAYGAGNPTQNAEIAAQAGSEANSQSQTGTGALIVTEACANPAGQSIACALAAGGSGTGNTITVTTSERFTFLTPLIGNLFGGGLTLSSSTTAAVVGLAASGGAGSNCTTPPTADFTVVVNDKTVTLDASDSSPTTGPCAISGYNWDMGDPADPNPNPPIVNLQTTYTYANYGVYTITLEVTNPTGNMTTSQQVTIGSTPSPTPVPSALPSAPASVAPAPIASAGPVCNTAPDFTVTWTGKTAGGNTATGTFNGTYTGQPVPMTWAWTFGSGQGTGTGQIAIHDYANSDNYTVTLTVTNGTCVKSTSHVETPPHS